MRALSAWLAPFVCLGGLAAGAEAWYPPQRPPAPDACGPGFYLTDSYGTVYGPSYYLQPPFPPSMMPSAGYNGGFGRGGPAMGPSGPPTLASHPYARSPRDFFMVYDP